MKKRKKTEDERTARIVRLVIAACLALFLWSYINGNDINLITQNIKNIPVTLINTEKLSSKGLVLSDQKDYYVNIRIRGSERNVRSLNASQITATADLSGVKSPGVYTADVVLQGLPNSVILQETQPSQLKINIDGIRQKRRKVYVNISGKPGNNLSVISASTPDRVRISGASEALAKVRKCIATVNVQDVTADTDVYLPVKAVDKKGDVVPNVECSPSMVKVHVKIGSTKRIKVKVPKTSGSTASGYKVSSISVSPKTVLVGGKTDVLESLRSIRPETVELNGIKNDMTVLKKLQLPNGVVSLSGNKNVMVSVKVEALSKKQLMVDDIEQRNVPDDLSVDKIENASVSVKVEGTSREMSNIDNKDIKAWIDFSNAAEGTGTYNIQVSTDKGTVKSVSPSSTTVTLKNKDK
ncbi:CdaR family protein [Pseudoramibacter sp.]|jgi:YbbR domain-containing protein|uniref:CdaR family protein n=1 Tax=Pseudoramibacter sp. TaxID=2034862 RepID=UPI0025E9AB87|nr:CdaR family protein [Pseudoramibacter sp.]MCH4072682.1 CdaR family protein [Pseudoramibacter sp.]MCH4106453.1 CdaR family protein [Pseudoramibacter sp.]